MAATHTIYQEGKEGTGVKEDGPQVLTSLQ